MASTFFFQVILAFGAAVNGQCAQSELQFTAAAEPLAGDKFGTALAARNAWAVIGAPGESMAGYQSGAVYVLRFENGQPASVGRLWREHARLTPTDGEWGARFGSAVAMDDSRIIVGAPEDWEAAQRSGSAYIFRRDSSNSPEDLLDDVWVQEAKLVLSSTERGVLFGSSVAISGEWALVGAPGDAYSGAVYLFRRDPTCSADENCTWTNTRRITHGYEFQGIGRAVALDSMHFVIGSVHDYNDGAAYVYRLQDTVTGSWALQDVLLPPSGTYSSFFGASVALLGSWLAVGAPSDEFVSVYHHYDGGTPSLPGDDHWIKVHQLSVAHAYKGFGAGLAFGPSRLLVGRPYSSDTSPTPGPVTVFGLRNLDTPDPNDDYWSQLTAINASVQHSSFGEAVAVSSFGAFVASPFLYADPPQPGKVHVYTLGGDCNVNGALDTTEIASGSSGDTNGDGSPDECKRDCNANGVPDSCELASSCGGVCATDCNANLVPDTCDIAVGGSADLLPAEGDGVPDQCQIDCNNNGYPDEQDIIMGISANCSQNGIPDECEPDCNENNVADSCDVLGHPQSDCNANIRPDSCDIVLGTSQDLLPQGGDGVPDECQSDCNSNGLLDDDEIELLQSADCDHNQVPDDCQTELHPLTPLILTQGPEFDTKLNVLAALAVDGETIVAGLYSRDLNLPYGVYNSEVFVVRSQDGGSTWSPATPLHPAALSVNSSDYVADIVTDGRGRWIAVWLSEVTPTGQLADDRDIYYSTSDDQGHTWTAPQILNLGTHLELYEDESSVQLATDQKGTWVAVWYDGPGGGEESYVARSVDNGNTWQHRFQLGGRMARGPAVATDGGGTWIVTWMTYGSFLDSDWDILFTKSYDNGETWSLPAPVNRDFAGDVEHDLNPNVESDGHDNWVIAWERFQPWDGPHEARRSIWYARSADDGTLWSLPASLQPPTSTGDDGTPMIRSDGFGRWIMAWNSTDSLGNTIGHDNDILFSTSTDNGATWTPTAPMMATATMDGYTGLGDMTTDRAGHWAVGFRTQDSAHPDGDSAVAFWYLSASPDCNCNGVPDDVDPTLSSDANKDCSINLVDYGMLASCLMGPIQTPASNCSQNFDADGDDDVDFIDASKFLNAFGG